MEGERKRIHCETPVYCGEEHKTSKKFEYEPDAVEEAKAKQLSSSLEILTAKRDIPCDMKLQTATETFPAHTEVLSAQSPVFEAMFRTNMKEAVEKCVYIDDMDAETVKRMIVFLYSGTLEEMEWKEAVNLYFAADKYQILSLKEVSSNSLKQNIDLSNCIALLRLAVMYQDNDLKTCGQDFIAENMPQILCCDQWKDLEKDIPQLSLEIFREIFRKNNLI